MPNNLSGLVFYFLDRLLEKQALSLSHVDEAATMYLMVWIRVNLLRS